MHFKMAPDKNYDSYIIRAWRALHQLRALTKFNGGQRPRTWGSIVFLSAIIFSMTYLEMFAGNRHWQKPVLPTPLKFRQDVIKSKIPRYRSDKSQEHQIPIWVISLKHSTLRRQNVMRAIRDPFEFVDALNISESLPMEEFQIIMGGPRLWSARRGDMFAQKKLSIDYGHIKILAKLLASSDELCVVLEDDAEPSSRNIDVQSEVLQILKKVPQDWDIVYLTEVGDHKVSSVDAASGIKILRSTSGTMAYMLRRKAALIVLAEIFTNKLWLNIDLLYSELIKDGKLNGYLALPGLLKRSSRVGESTLDYKSAYKNPIYRATVNIFG